MIHGYKALSPILLKVEPENNSLLLANKRAKEFVWKIREVINLYQSNMADST